MKQSSGALFVSFLEPLRRAFASPSEFYAFLGRYGWRLPIPADFLEAGALADVKAAVEGADAIIESILSVDEQDIAQEQVLQIRNEIRSLWEVIGRLVEPGPRDGPPVLDIDELWSSLAGEVPADLVHTFLQRQFPTVFELLRLLLIVEETQIVPGDDASTFRIPYVQKRLNWSYLGDFLSSPVQHLKEVYEWGGQRKSDREMLGFQYDQLASRLADFLHMLGIITEERMLDAEVFPGYPVDGLLEDEVPAQLELIVVDAELGDPPVVVEAGLILGPATSGSSNPEGLEITNILEGSVSESGEIASGLNGRVSGEAEADGLFGVTILPSGVTTFVRTVATGAHLEVELSTAEDSPVALVGRAGGARLEATGASIGAELAVDGIEKSEVRLDASAAIRIVIVPGPVDGFLAEVLGSSEIAIDGKLEATWSSVGGFRLQGGVGFEIEIPLDVDKGPITVTKLGLALSGGNDGAELVASVSGGLHLGVIAAVVEEIGLKVVITPDESGPPEVDIGFKPPIGLGLTIDAGGVVTGGGYLYYDSDLAEYGGMAELGFLSLNLSAIGILTTRMSDGTAGWSLFLSVFSEFPAVQLGFGITLNGVGGLVGLHRTFDDDALRTRLLDGALDSIMFPEDPVANAPRILEDIRTVFPPCQEQFVFGAMLKLGWGTPPILTVDLGVIIELPDPVKIALLGQLYLVLPTADAPIIEINMDVFGLIDLGDGLISLDASLRDSHILGLMELSGDMAFRASFGQKPTMLMSMGGFHPKFTPPAGMPILQRMQAQLPVGRIGSVDVSCYIAVTSNTFQLGGRVDITVKAASFSAQGYFGFDALIQFQPFGFDFSVVFGVTVSAGKITLMGVDVAARVVGPGPWLIDGEATFKILKIKKKLNVDFEVGERKTVALPTTDVAELLEEALGEPANWTVPDREAPGVILAEGQPNTLPALDPGGIVVFSQKIVPFGLKLDKFGAGGVKGQSRFDIESTGVGESSEPHDAARAVGDWFAPGEFIQMDEAEKLKAASYEFFDCGVEIGGEGAAFGGGQTREIVFEEITVDPALNFRRKPGSRTGRSGTVNALTERLLSQKLDSPRPDLKAEPVFHFRSG